jgi:hypothetical protein
LHGAHGLAADNPHAQLGHLRLEMLAQVVVETAQDILAPVDQGHLGAQPVEDGGELDGDVAAALDQNAGGQFVEMERLVRGDDVFDAGDRRAEPRRSAGGDQDVARTDRFSRCDEADGVCVFQHGAALDEFDASALEIGGIGEFKPRDLPVLVGDERPPVEPRFVQRPAVAGGVFELIGKARGIDEQLLGNAAADHTRTADAVLLGDQDARAVTGCDPRRAHASRARADDDEIEVMISHVEAYKPPMDAASRCRDLAFSFPRAFWR